MANSHTDETKSESLSGDYVLAVVSTPGTAEKAVEELLSHGHEPASVLSERDFAEILDPTGSESGGIKGFLKRFGGHLSEQQNFQAQYKEEAGTGKGIVAVHVKDRYEAETGVASILATHGGMNMRHFGTLAVTDLTPDTNPNAQGDVAHPGPAANHV
jgi:phage-related minor tail protein